MANVREERMDGEGALDGWATGTAHRKGLSRAEFLQTAGAAIGAVALVGVLPTAAHAAGGLTASTATPSSEDNKALTFDDIPKEALVSVGQLYALIEGDMSLEDVMAGKPAPGEEGTGAAEDGADAAGDGVAPGGAAGSSAAPGASDAGATGSPSAPAASSKVPTPATTLPGKMETMRFTDFMLVDIRSHRDYSKRLINGSRNIPAGRQMDIRIDEIPTDKPVFLIAAKNTDRLAETRQTLVDAGRDPDLIKVVDGGVNAWVKAGYPTLENQFLGC